MNVGYMRFGDFDNPVHSEKCPICDKNIYISKYYTNYACVDINCPLGHGAKQLIEKINKIIDA